MNKNTAQAVSERAASQPLSNADSFLTALGDRVRRLRAIRGMTRKELSRATGVSERHLANLELGAGNVSILVLRQIAHAFNCPMAELLGDITTSNADWLLIRDILSKRSEADLQRARQALTELFDDPQSARNRDRTRKIALVGLRGAGKSTLGRMLAQSLDVPFIELSQEIERVAGCGIPEIHSLYGPTAYRRYERRALEEVLQLYPEMVLATPGGLVSEPATLNLMLAHCYTVWLQADPEDHMRRVMEQGDFRPMAGNAEAMEDLKRILAGREPFYSKADWACTTSNMSLQAAFEQLRDHLRADIASRNVSA